MQRATTPQAGTTELVVVYRLGSLGDTVVALPCFHLIRRKYPAARIAVLTNKPVSSLAAPLGDVLMGTPLIDEVAEYRVGASASEIWKIVRRLRERGARTLIYLNDREQLASVWMDWVFFRWCGFTTIHGMPFQARNRHPQVENGVQEPEIRRLSRCLAGLGTTDIANASSWELYLTSAERAAAASLLQDVRNGRYLSMHAGGKGEHKDWGVENWRALLSELRDSYGGFGLVAVGAAEDAARAGQLLAAWRGPTANICGKASPRETAAVLSHAACFVGHDSGPMHLAAAVGAPTIGIFGSGNEPNRWHPTGRRTIAIHERAGVGRIEPRRVAVHVREFIGEPFAQVPPAVPREAQAART